MEVDDGEREGECRLAAPQIGGLGELADKPSSFLVCRNVNQSGFLSAVNIAGGANACNASMS